MEFFLIGQDGNEYGPYSIDVLRAWKESGDLTPSTKLKDPLRGTIREAGSVPGIFLEETPVVLENYERPNAPQKPFAAGNQTGEGYGVLILVLVQSLIGLALYTFNGLGILIAGYAVYDAVRAKRSGSRWGNAALGVSIATFVIIAVGITLRFFANRK